MYYAPHQLTQTTHPSPSIFHPSHRGASAYTVVPSAVSAPAAPAAPWEPVADADSQADLTLAGSETLRIRSSHLCFNKHSRWFWCLLTFLKHEMPFRPLLAKMFCLSKNCWNMNSSMKLSLILCPARTTASCVSSVSFSTPFLVLSPVHLLGLLWQSLSSRIERARVCACVRLCVCFLLCLA